MPPDKAGPNAQSRSFLGDTPASSTARVGVAVAHRLNLARPVILHGSYASGAGTEHVGRAGLAFEF